MDEVGHTLRTQKKGDQVRIEPTTANISVPRFQPDQPFNTRVKRVEKTFMEKDTAGDFGEEITGDSWKYEIVFEPSPEDEEAEKYTIIYKHFVHEDYQELKRLTGIYVRRENMRRSVSKHAIAGIESIERND